MKNKKISQLLIVASIGICMLTHSLYSTVGVYLENNYGATLNYKISPTISEGQYIGNNVRIFLGDVDFIPELSIRTTGTGSSYVSYYYDLGYMLNEIKSLQNTHNNEDAVITIHPSRVAWHVTYAWEKKGTVKPFEYESFVQKPIQPIPGIEKPTQVPIIPSVPADGQKKKEEALMELTTADQRLVAIRNGALGPEYAQKTKEICDANYAQAEKLGKINLCSELKRSLVAPVYRIDTRAKKKGIIQPDLAPAIDEIKASINRLHGALARYKSRGEAL